MLSRLRRAAPAVCLRTLRHETTQSQTWFGIGPGSTIADLTPQLHRLKLAEDRFVLHDKAPVSVAAHHLATQRLTWCLVVDDDASAVGMVTERDLLRYSTHAESLAFFSGGKEDPCVNAWMTKREDMLSVRLDDTLEHAASLMKSGIWRHLPVLDYWGKLHSILDLRDVVSACWGEYGERTWENRLVADVLGAKRRNVIGEPQGSSWTEQLQAYLLAQSERHTVSVRAPVAEAALKLASERLTFLVVVDGPKVLGLVTERSFLSFCVGFQNSAGPESGVHSIMTPIDQVVTVSLTDPASTCIDKFYMHNLRHLPVVNKSNLIGIISARDMLRPLLPN